MRFKNTSKKIKEYVNDRKDVICVISFSATIIFALFNRFIGAIQGSVWHESISIYYFALASARLFLELYPTKSQNENKDLIVDRAIKISLVLLNLLLVVPIVLLLLEKRAVTMTMRPSIVIALYVTIKTIVTIVNFAKKRYDESSIVRALSTIDIMDMVVSILTLQNTLIAVNGASGDAGLRVLTIIVGSVGFLASVVLTIVFLINEKKSKL